MEAPEVRYARRDGRAIAYQTWGSGGLDYLIIGDWPHNCDAMWEHPGHLRLWRFHGSMARVVRFDRPGIGSSDPARSEIDDVEGWAEDAIAVLDAEASQRAAVAGEGWGSQAAIALAVNHPERVDRLVLLNGYARMLQDDTYPDGVTEDAAARTVELVRSIWGSGTVISSAAPALGHEYSDLCARYERLAASPSVAAAMTGAMFASDVRRLLSQVTCPTLVVYTGEYGHIGEGHSRYLADHIDGAALLEVRTDQYYDLLAEASRDYVEFLTGATHNAWGERQLAVVVFSDIVESTAQLARRGDRQWTNVLEDCHDAVVREVGRFGGRVVKQTGDGHLLTFASPGAAISAVFGMRRAAHVLRVLFRFGVHMGEIEARADGDIAGITVHTAARIAERAGGDEILVSRVVSDLLAGTGLELIDLGSHHLKGLLAPMQLFSVSRPNRPQE